MINLKIKAFIGLMVAALPYVLAMLGLRGTLVSALVGASVSQRLYGYLQNEQLIRNLDSIDESRWSEIKVGGIIELGARFELSAMDLIVDLFAYYSSFVKEVADKKTKAALHFIKMLGSRDGFDSHPQMGMRTASSRQVDFTRCFRTLLRVVQCHSQGL